MAKTAEVLFERKELLGGVGCSCGVVVVLLAECGVAELKMSQFGITRESLGAVAEKSVDRRYANERAPLSREEALTILEESYA